MMKTPNSNSRSKHTLMRPVLHLLRLIPVSVPCSVNLLRGQSSSACFPPANRPVERSKFFPAMRPAVRHPNRIYKQRFMKNADAKLQAPQCAEATRRGSTPAQMWQKLESIESLAKEQSQQQNGINDKLTVLKEQQAATIASPKPQTWAAMAANAKTRPPLYNKNNGIVVKLNDNASAEEMKKQAPEEVAHRIDAYLIENNITTTNLRAARTLPSGDIAIQTTNEEEAEKLRGEDGWTKVLGSKAKLARKWYGIVALGIPIAKIDLEKAEETKEKIVTQNASMCAGMKVESIFWLCVEERQAHLVTSNRGG